MTYILTLARVHAVPDIPCCKGLETRTGPQGLALRDEARLGNSTESL